MNSGQIKGDLTPASGAARHPRKLTQRAASPRDEGKEGGAEMVTAWLHDAPLAAALVAVCVLIAAVLTVILVAMTPRDRRVKAIRAVALVLGALLPWRLLAGLPARRARRPACPRRRPPHACPAASTQTLTRHPSCGCGSHAADTGACKRLNAPDLGAGSV